MTLRKRLHSDPDIRPRLQDVATFAGVSTATVSRVLNGSQGVTHTLSERVLNAVAQLGYVPHGAARALASRRSRIIGAIVPTIDNAIFSTSLQSMQERLSEFGYMLLLASSDYDLVREHRETQALVEKGIDGLIMVGESHAPETYALLERENIPYVNTWSYSEETSHPCIGFDNFLAASRLTNYLIDIGHRKVAMIAGISDGNDRAASRIEGVRHALRARGLDFYRGQIEERRYSIEEGRKVAGAWLSDSSPPTAIICGNDVLALGALFECLHRGIDVPGAVSITGFDNLDIAEHVKPALTTVAIPSAEMGRLAADHLIAKLTARSVSLRTRLNTDLLIRDTTAPPAGNQSKAPLCAGKPNE